MKKFTKKDYGVFCVAIVLVFTAMMYEQKIQDENKIYFPRPLSDDDIKKYSNTDSKAVIIFPTLTFNAYKKGGFYDYFNGTCNSCKTVSLRPFYINATYITGLHSFEYLTDLKYPIIDDTMVDKNPHILDDYDKIILLHNEYMTKTEFEAIKNHKNVIYLYPNSMYVEVEVDYDSMTMSLVRGHGYPQSSIANGFDYVTSSKHEYDFNCKNYKWVERPNGIQPSCWPEFLIESDRNMLQMIKDYPNKTPDLIKEVQAVNITKLPHCDAYGNCQ